MTQTCSSSGTTSAALVAITVDTVGNGDMKRDSMAVLACNRITLKIMAFVKIFLIFAFANENQS